MLRWLLVLVWVVGSGVFVAEADAAEEPPYIEVTGTASISVPPDFVEWRVKLMDEGPDAAAIKKANDYRAEAIAELADDLRVDEADFETGSVSVERRYRWNTDSREQVFTGYRIQREVVLRQRDLEAFDDFLTGVTGGGNSFTMSPRSTKEKELRWQARLDAVAVARDKAVAMAGVLDATVGRPLRVSAVAPFSSAPRFALSSALSNTARSSDDVLPELVGDYRPGEIDFSATVSARFELK